MTELELARKNLTEDLTCVIVLDGRILQCKERGVAPLLKLLDSGEQLDGCSAADRVVCKAAAFLYVLLGASAVWAKVMSEPAREVLRKNGIQAECDNLVPAIRNREDTGFCPMESAVWTVTIPEQVPGILKETMKRLSKQ